MIFYRNYGPRLRTKQDEVEAIRRCVGGTTLDHDGEPTESFELIELVRTKGSPNPTKTHGYQDVDITRLQDGTLTITHRRPGEGTLRFEPSPYGNPVGYLARTPHNIKTLVHSYRKGDWTFTDKTISQEIKQAYEKWWNELPKTDKEKIVYQEELDQRSRYDIPGESGPAKTDHSSEKLLKEIAKLKEANRQLQEVTAPEYGKKTAAVDGLSPESPPPEPPKSLTPESDPPESPASPPDPWIITLKNGDTLDFHKLKTFAIRAMGPKYGLHFENTSTIEFMVPKIIEKIKQVEAQESAA